MLELHRRLRRAGGEAAYRWRRRHGRGMSGGGPDGTGGGQAAGTPGPCRSLRQTTSTLCAPLSGRSGA